MGAPFWSPEWREAAQEAHRMEWIYLVIGLAAGVVLGWAIFRLREGERTADLRIAKAQLEQELRAEREKLQWTEVAEQKLREAFTALASQSLSTNSQQFLTNAQKELKTLVDPLSQKLDTMDQQVRALETKREGAYGKLGEQLRSLGEAQSELQRTTVSLEQALKSPTARGRWGELQLRRVVELAGMVKHVDFDEQPTTDEGRPDLIVRLPGGGVLPVDAKASASAYLDAMQTEGDRRSTKLDEHVRAMRSRIQDLSRKQYWSQFDRAPELVVMFVPFESALSAAFEKDPELLEYGIRQHILVASPVTLLALLRAVAFGWQQQQITENARQIANEGRELFARVLNVLRPFRDTGTHLGRAVEAYDQAVGSLEHRLFPALHRMKDLTASSDELPETSEIRKTPRLPEAPNEEA
jgi:DNA recombination protein RmuC